MILPPNLQAQREAEQREKQIQDFKNKKIELPPELAQEVKKLLPQVQDLNKSVEELLKTQAGWIALLSQESFRKLLNDYMGNTIPQVVVEACKMDRMALLNAMQQVMSNEIANAQVNKSSLDPASYQKAVSDFACVFRQAPVPPLNLQIALPEFEFDPPGNKDLKLVPE